MLPDLSSDIKYAVPKQTGSAFLASAIKAREQYMVEDLAKSGLTPHMVRAYTEDILPLSEGAQGGYYLPYFDLDGKLMRTKEELTMYRLRQYGCKDRYKQPASSQLEQLHIPKNPPYILPRVHDYVKESKVLYIAEGEKKAAACCHHLDIGTIGIGGCWNWGSEKKLHPWIKAIIERNSVEHVVVIPDGDIQRYDICTAYGTLAHQLNKLGVKVDIVVLPEPEDKIDDLIVEWGLEAQGVFADLGKLSAADLVVSQQVLAENYGLSTVGKDRKIAVNDTNITKLLDEHPAFGDFWFNSDRGLCMIDDNVVGEYTDMDLAMHMQHYFQMHTVTRQRVNDCMRGLCEKNTRSPHMEWVCSVEWDGVPRLEDWPIRLCGCADSRLTREVSSKFLVGMYARIAKPGCKMDWMMVTVGGQGIGKSWWADLVSNGRGITFMASGNSRDDVAKLHKGLVICIDEMDAFNKRELTYWKTLITTSVDTYRAPYDRTERELPRSSVLYGTSNHSTFLRHDDTGQRRFGVLQPSSMLKVDLFKEELQQIWAEAKAVYDSGELKYFELSAAVKAETAEMHAGEDPLAQQVEEFLSRWQSDKFKMLDLLEYLDMRNHVQNRSITGQLKDMLISRGCIHKKKMRIGTQNGVSGYTIDRTRWELANVGGLAP